MAVGLTPDAFVVQLGNGGGDRFHQSQPLEHDHQNSNRFNLYWTSARTVKELHAWCLENGKTSRKYVLIKAIEQNG